MRKICPYHHYDLLRISQWLNEQSASGWEMEVWGVFWVKFREIAEGEHFAYQVDMDDNTGEPGMFRREELSKFGWEYVGTIGTTRAHIYRHRNKNARLPRNEAYIAFNQKKLNGELVWSGILGLFVVGLLVYFFVLRNEFLLLQFMRQRIGLLAFYVVWILILLCQIVADIYQNIKLYRYLDDYNAEVQIEDKQAKGKRGFYFPSKFLTWVAVVFYGMILFGVQDRQIVENLEDAKACLKYVDLAEIEGENFTITEISWEDYPDVNFGNRIEYRKVPLAHTYYEINQYGKNSKKEEQVQMEGLYWNVKREKTAEKLFEQLVECYIKYPYGYSIGFRNYKYSEDSDWIKTEISDERFTELVVASGIGYRFEGDQQVFARIGNQIICLRYFGEIDIEMLVEAIARNYT